MKLYYGAFEVSDMFFNCVMSAKFVFFSNGYHTIEQLFLILAALTTIIRGSGID